MRNLIIILALVLISTIGLASAFLAVVGLVALLHFVQWEQKTYTRAITGQRTVKRQCYA